MGFQSDLSCESGRVPVFLRRSMDRTEEERGRLLPDGGGFVWRVPGMNFAIGYVDSTGVW